MSLINKLMPVVVLVAMSTGGCATTTVSAKLKLPPRSKFMQDAQSVLVTEFGGSRGPAASSKIRSAINIAKFHTLVNNADNDARSQELAKRLQAGENVTVASASAGATVIIAGNVPADAYQGEMKVSDTEKCVEKQKVGKKEKCVRKVKVPIYKIVESCTVEISAKATNVADNSIIFERSFSKVSSNEDGWYESQPASKRGQICNWAYQAAIDDVVPFITPYTTVLALEFHDVDDESGTTDKAVSAMEVGNLEKAFALFSKAVELPKLDEENRGWARYNLALIMSAKADFAGCLDQIAQAEEAVGSDSLLKNLKTNCEEYVQ